MAEYNQIGVLSALLLFTALTARDIYLVRTGLQQGQVTTSSLYRDPGQAKPKSTLYNGPVLKFQYW